MSFLESGRSAGFLIRHCDMNPLNSEDHLDGVVSVGGGLLAFCRGIPESIEAARYASDVESADGLAPASLSLPRHLSSTGRCQRMAAAAPTRE